MIMPNENVLKAISWTLIHSVWQGLILAIFAGLVIVFTRKSRAAVRYNILSGLFLMFMVAVGFTFNYEYQQETAMVFDGKVLVLEAQESENILVASTSVTAPDYLKEAISYLNRYATTIVVIWFLIFAIKCFGVFRNLTNVYRIRNYKVHNSPEYWNSKVADLSKRLNIKKQIVLLESQLVKVPSVTGLFKPIILVPVGLLSNLPQDQIEAILLHELAHIRRKDYFINLLQSFAEILFFFNPGLLWISSLIKDERENCCDDIAVTITQSKSKFIHALVSFQEYNMKQNELALGFGKNKNQLLARAKRIIQDNNKSLNTVEKTFLSLCIIVMLTFSLACSNTKATTAKTDEKENNSEIAYLKDLTKENLLTDEEIRQTKIDVQDAEKEVAIAKAEAVTAQIKAENTKAEAQLALQESKVSQDEIKLYEVQATQDQIESEKARKEHEIVRKEHERARKEHEIARKEHEKLRKENEIARREDKKAWKEHEKARKEHEKTRKEHEKTRKEHEKARREHEKARIEAEKYRKSTGTTYQIVRPMTFEEAQKSGICIITDKTKADMIAQKEALIKQINEENKELIEYSRKIAQGKMIQERKALMDAFKEKRELWIADQKAKFLLKRAEMFEIKKIKEGDLQKMKFNRDSLYKIYKLKEGKKTGSIDISNDINSQIIQVLKKEKAIVGVDNLSYKLSPENIILNGKTITGNMHHKLTKYLNPNTSAIYYNYDVAKQDLIDSTKPRKS